MHELSRIAIPEITADFDLAIGLLVSDDQAIYKALVDGTDFTALQCHAVGRHLRKLTLFTELAYEVLFQKRLYPVGEVEPASIEAGYSADTYLGNLMEEVSLLKCLCQTFRDVINTDSVMERGDLLNRILPEIRDRSARAVHDADRLSRIVK